MMVEPATAADEAEAGVLIRSLLEEEEEPPGDVSLMATETATVQLDVNAIVAQQHAAAHQARAAAALEQHRQDQQQQQQYHHNHGGDGTSEQQHQATTASTPPPIVTQGLNPQTPTTGLQSSGQADLEGETSLTPGSQDLTLSAAPPPSICLCQQPARIPRPRNAFILFRQHNQAAVVAQHPGKPNPEISKIIGEMWRESPQETKNIWQKHADEEKKQHLARYPEYRYQPRRNGKKNAAAAAAAFSSAGASGALSPSIETIVCPTCGGRTGTLSTPPTPATPSSAVPKTPRLPPPPHISRPPSAAPPPTKKRRTGSSDDQISHAAGPTTVDAAGVEALLQLGHLQDSEDSTPVGALPETSTPHKKRKHTTENSPMAAILTTTNTITPLQHNLYFPQPVHDPNIDPYLRQNGFDSDSPTATLDHESHLASATPHHNLTPFPTHHHHLSDAYIIIKSLPILDKIHAFSKICKPLSNISTPGIPRMPIVSIEGDDTETVTDLFTALAKDIRKSEPLQLISEPDPFLDETDIDGLLIPKEKDGNGDGDGDGDASDADDADAANYLAHVAAWRRRCVDIKKAVLPQNSGAMAFAQSVDAMQGGAPQVVLVNRYMVSRSDVAAGRLSCEGLTPMQHWQWCATVWRGCVGADMTIVVNMVADGVGSEDAVEVKEGGRIVFVRKEAGRKGWEEKVVRRLGFEVGEVVRSLRGFGG